MDFFPQFFSFLLVRFTKKLDHLSNSLDFAAGLVSGCLTLSSVSVFSEEKPTSDLDQIYVQIFESHAL